ncbi:short-chain dehydrogenase/reductase SDR [Bacteroides coprosuis DSM 18011]|uniref:Short-chain dehydrogenase/reductase SDR n=1 Tax=Bacteroides coprosuis DSM 18011 TaxID=679937 RepID=F3ZTI5_9BACE|nr:SDR family NAD(P)-dependent oxidoreductase [Bacteroides coprosuis]EGJ71075.1 short-chain dehydrogenase/reductase SDR [Bacteroides coprosuis DSM 18011]
MKRIVIVGATSGIGLELTKIYIDKGWKVGVAGRREHLLSSIKKKYPQQVEYEVIDIIDSEAPTHLQSLIQKLGGMDLYFHSSGIGFQNPKLKSDIELNTIQTNVYGFTQMVNTAYHFFKEQGKGHIAIISSIAGTKGLGVAPAYSATKRFQNTYIDALEQLNFLSKGNIIFTDIRPGFVQTDLLKGSGSYPLLMHPQKVAQIIDKALVTHTRRIVIDWRYKILVFFWKLIPACLWKRLPIKNKEL